MSTIADFLRMHITQFSDALCREFSSELFFSDIPSQIEKAKLICSFCAHSDQCRIDARVRGEHYGVFGGEDSDERKEFLNLGIETHSRYSPVRDLREMGLSVNTIVQRLNIQRDSVTRNLRRNAGAM